ncbi:MAG TPA: YdcF family protein [Rhizomicrobium sp.]|nr:YdcF family protein [Rhizomicrobium sp.]
MEQATKRSAFGGFLIFALAAIAAYTIGFVYFTLTLPKTPDKIDSPDAIVALTGGGARLDAAVALFERGIGKRLLITGVYSTTTKRDLKSIVHGGRRFDCCVDLGFAAEDTHGNASETATWMRAHHYRRLVVVTASYHMPRSMAEFSSEMPGVKLAAYPVEPDGIDLNSWWRDPRAIRLLQAEYAKYLASLVLTKFIHQSKPLDRAIPHGEAKLAS